MVSREMFVSHGAAVGFVSSNKESSHWELHCSLKGRTASAASWEKMYQFSPCLAVPVLPMALLEAICEQSLSCSLLKFHVP